MSEIEDRLIDEKLLQDYRRENWRSGSLGARGKMLEIAADVLSVQTTICQACECYQRRHLADENRCVRCGTPYDE